MPNIVDRFGQLVDDAIPKPELARQLLLLGYRAKDVQLLLAPEKELTPARQYAAQIAMDAMIAPLAHPQRAALVNIFMPCELLHAFHLLPMFAEATACYLNGAAAERGFIHYAESAGISPTLCSYHKALLGMGLSGTAGKPLFTACTSIACDANNLTFRRLAQHYGIPHFYLDVPYDHDEYAVAEVSDRLREFAAFLEDVTHQKLDEAALQQAVAHSGRALELCRMQQIDGVVYFCQWGCKQTMGAAQLFKSALEAEGYPVLLLDGDGCDRANTMDGQTATRLDAFLEMLHSKQEALV